MFGCGGRLWALCEPLHLSSTEEVTMTTRTLINFKSKEEKKQIARLAKDAGLSISNWFRVRAGLEPLAHGGKRKRKKVAA
jgi:hypothetical protein